MRIKTFNRLCEFVETVTETVMQEKFQTIKGLKEQWEDNKHKDKIKIVILVDKNERHGIPNMEFRMYTFDQKGNRI